MGMNLKTSFATNFRELAAWYHTLLMQDNRTAGLRLHSASEAWVVINALCFAGYVQFHQFGYVADDFQSLRFQNWSFNNGKISKIIRFFPIRFSLIELCVLCPTKMSYQ